MTIKWSDIKEQYEGLEVGFRERVVALFRKYEGQDTDEKVRGKVVLVSQRSFAEHMGIAQRTFSNWCGLANTAQPDSEPAALTTEEPAVCMNEGIVDKQGFVFEINRAIEAKLANKHFQLHVIDDVALDMLTTDIIELRNLLDELDNRITIARQTRKAQQS
jgi:hypothetical protein